ncbi:MAG: N-acetylmuramoyl-L-alanine amidase [Adlercreutzia sp.]|nr:N-acetylmuramoyl-L-alanine amidase [Adlercreutzia sp.]
MSLLHLYSSSFREDTTRPLFGRVLALASLTTLSLTILLALGGCSAQENPATSASGNGEDSALEVSDTEDESSASGSLDPTEPTDRPTKLPESEPTNQEKADSIRGANRTKEADQQSSENAANDSSATAPNRDATDIEIHEDYRDSFVHGDKPASCQKYIVLHDTEGDGSAQDTIDWWDSNGNLVAAHFIVNKDGSIWQCVPLDKIAHHAGYGDTGHNERYGTSDESRDDMRGSVPIGSNFADYGMNSFSIGIEMVHAGGEYPEAQLEAVDQLIAYIDAYYGFESTIIDHKAWRSGNSDTSAEFAPYLRSYQSKRTHE